LINGAKSAVTITAAALAPDKPEVSVDMPKRDSMACIDCKVIPKLASPVPDKPTTKPYPTNWLLRTPAKLAKSFIRSAWARLASPESQKQNAKLTKSLIVYPT